MNITPTVGITGTPVIGGSAAVPYLYVVAATQSYAAGAFNPTYVHRLYALDLTTGQKEILQGGQEITSPDSVFDSSTELQGSALLLDNGTLYVAFDTNGLPGSYHGWLFGYDSTSLQQTGHFDVTPEALQGGIGQSGGGPSTDRADPNHSVFVSTGNGPFNASRGGTSFSDSFLRLGTSGGLSVSNYFTPCDQATLQAAGLDFGASAPVLLPDSAGSTSQPHLLIGGSNDGFLYVVNRDSMGNFCPPTGVQTVSVGGAIMSTPLFWNGAVYVVPAQGNLLELPMSAGILAPPPAEALSPETLGPQGATPVISSDGTSNAILWLIDTSGTAAILRAYDPSNHLNEIYNSGMVAARDGAGPAVRSTVPTVANGKVYVGTQAELDVYGFLQ